MTKRIRKIRKIGTSNYIGLKPIDMEDLEIETEDKVDIENIKVIKKGKKKK